MINVIRSEWIKARTVRMNTVLAICAIGVPLLIVGIASAVSNTDTFDAGDLVSTVTFTTVLSGILIGVMGASGITAEFGFNTIRPTFAATPRRFVVVLAKAIVTMLVALIVGVIAIVSSLALGGAIVSQRGGDANAFGASDLRAELIGAVLFMMIMSLLGLAIGLVVRSTPAAVAFLILWPLMIENLLIAALRIADIDISKWMPYQAGLLLAQHEPSADSLGRVWGGLYFFGVTLAVLAIGSVITQRRDA